MRGTKMKTADKRKVKSSSVVEDGITFKSRLERACYLRFKQSGIHCSYESETFVLMPKKELSHTVRYERALINKELKKYGLKRKSQVLRPLTYTPDFVLHFPDIVVYIDTKGFATDRYVVKKKLFLAYVDEHIKDAVYFFEPHNNSEIEEMVSLIKQLKDGKVL